MQTTKKVLIVGCGDLGTALAHQLQAQGISAIGLSRSLSADTRLLRIQADVTQPSSLSTIADINPDFVVYCVAASAQTDENYRQHYVQGLANVLNALDGASNLKHVFFVSSTRMYGASTEALLDEHSDVQALDFGAQRLLEAENLLRLTAKTWTYTTLRLTGIYGPGRTRMLTLAAHPSQWPQQNTWTNRIHRDDAAAFVLHLINRLMAGQSIQDCYIVTDSCPVSQYEVLHYLAEKMGISIATPPPPVLGGKRMSNQRMLSTGFHLKYPDYQLGYSAMLDAV